MRAAAALLALALAPGALLPAQGGWTPPRPPCDLPPANSKINNAITALKTAGEKPEARDQQLAQAKRLARDKRDALANAWHLVVRRVQGHPAAQRVLRLRAGLDSTQRGITSDSTVLARLLASAQSRKARGTRLAPADQQLFTRDSTARAQGVAQRREHLTASLGQIAADSSALVAAFAQAIDALLVHVTPYPVDPVAPISLATLYA